MSGRGEGRGGRGGRGRGYRGRGRGRGRGGRGRGRNSNNNNGRGRGNDGDQQNKHYDGASSPSKRFKNDALVANDIPSHGFNATTTEANKMDTAASVAAAPSSSSSKLAHVTQQKFADLKISAQSRKAMAEVFKYEYMTAVQAETLPLILKDNTDCLAKAKTGTGKTLAFMIPTIEKILTQKSNSNDIQCLVISPTRELAQQIGEETKKLLTFQPAHLRKVVICVGGTNKNKDLRMLQGKTPIVVATPGRLLDHLNDGLASRMTNLSCLCFGTLHYVECIFRIEVYQL